MSAPENANARRQPGERTILTNCDRSVAPVSAGIKLISSADGTPRNERARTKRAVAGKKPPGNARNAHGKGDAQ